MSEIKTDKAAAVAEAWNNAIENPDFGSGYDAGVTAERRRVADIVEGLLEPEHNLASPLCHPDRFHDRRFEKGYQTALNDVAKQLREGNDGK